MQNVALQRPVLIIQIQIPSLVQKREGQVWACKTYYCTWCTKIFLFSFFFNFVKMRLELLLASHNQLVASSTVLQFTIWPHILNYLTCIGVQLSVSNTGMLGNISFAYNTWTHVAFQYNNQTKQQVRVFLFFFSVWWWSSNTCNYPLWLLIVCQVVRDYPSLLKHQIKATQ